MAETQEFQTGQWNIKAAALSDVGKVRSHNEDSFAVLPEHGILIASDGMGGHNAGALASKIVVEVLPKMIFRALNSLQKPSLEEVQKIVCDSVIDLSGEIWNRSRREPELVGMGATFVLVMFQSQKAIVAHMGDSRAYLLRDSGLRLLTEDHSVVGLLLREGLITVDQASEHPAKGKLSRYVGMRDEVFPDVHDFEFHSGDRLLLCTDGLNGEVSDSQIENLFKADVSLEEITGSLVKTAKDAGGSDNITVLLMEGRKVAGDRPGSGI